MHLSEIEAAILEGRTLRDYQQAPELAVGDVKRLLSALRAPAATGAPNPDTHCPECRELLSIYGHCWQHHYPPMDPALDRRPAALPEGYLTWAQLRACLVHVTDPRLLAEPVLFTHLDGYGSTTAYPVQLLTESIHPQEQRTLSFVSLVDEYTFSFLQEHDSESDPLRVLPPGGLYLHFSEMDEDLEEQLQFLSVANPHTPPLAPAAPGPAPLFE